MVQIQLLVVTLVVQDVIVTLVLLQTNAVYVMAMIHHVLIVQVHQTVTH